MRARLGIGFSVLLLLIPISFTAQCKTCKNSQCHQTTIELTTCTPFSSVTPFQTTSVTKRDTNQQYACLKIEYFNGDATELLQQCFITPNVFTACDSIGEHVNYNYCEVETPLDDGDSEFIKDVASELVATATSDSLKEEEEELLDVDDVSSFLAKLQSTQDGADETLLYSATESETELSDVASEANDTTQLVEESSSISPEISDHSIRENHTSTDMLMELKEEEELLDVEATSVGAVEVDVSGSSARLQITSDEADATSNLATASDAEFLVSTESEVKVTTQLVEESSSLSPDISDTNETSDDSIILDHTSSDSSTKSPNTDQFNETMMGSNEGDHTATNSSTNSPTSNKLNESTADSPKEDHTLPDSSTKLPNSDQFNETMMDSNKGDHTARVSSTNSPNSNKLNESTADATKEDHTLPDSSTKLPNTDQFHENMMDSNKEDLTATDSSTNLPTSNKLNESTADLIKEEHTPPDSSTKSPITDQFNETMTDSNEGEHTATDSSTKSSNTDQFNETMNDSSKRDQTATDSSTNSPNSNKSNESTADSTKEEHTPPDSSTKSPITDQFNENMTDSNEGEHTATDSSTNSLLQTSTMPVSTTWSSSDSPIGEPCVANCDHGDSSDHAQNFFGDSDGHVSVATTHVPDEPAAEMDVSEEERPSNFNSNGDVSSSICSCGNVLLVVCVLVGLIYIRCE